MRIDIRTEHKFAPPAVEARIARAGGWNRLGQPNFRVVWGWSRPSLFGGKWEEWDLDASGRVRSTTAVQVSYGYRWLPKYEPWFCWHLERWMPPEHFGTPASWYARYRTVEDGREFYELGPYPHRGEYEHCFPILDRHKPDLPIELTPSLIDYVVAAIEYSRQVVGKDPVKNLEALRAREARKERDWEAYADAVLDDAAPAFHGQPTSFPQPKTPRPLFQN